MLPSLLLPPSLYPGLGGRRDGGEGAGSQGMGGALVLRPLELVLPPARGGVGGAVFQCYCGQGRWEWGWVGWPGRSVESVPLHWLWCSGSVSLPGMMRSPQLELWLLLLVTE